MTELLIRPAASTDALAATIVEAAASDRLPLTPAREITPGAAAPAAALVGAWLGEGALAGAVRLRAQQVGDEWLLLLWLDVPLHERARGAEDQLWRAALAQAVAWRAESLIPTLPLTVAIACHPERQPDRPMRFLRWRLEPLSPGARATLLGHLLGAPPDGMAAWLAPAIPRAHLSIWQAPLGLLLERATLVGQPGCRAGT